ncbi:DNA replication terminus site-binding protein [Salmonella enterica subsp. enterica serovar Choleraesuis]|nr:DNA replication terminus site-binding protein [Salmonella enterica subsp. enterica serovar Choleraesuis]
MDYDLPQRLTATFRAMELNLLELKEQMSACRLLVARTFELPPVVKGEEENPREQIEVRQRLGKKAWSQTLDHFSHLFIQQQSENHSTKAALRLPGAVCLEVSPDQRMEILRLTETVNGYKEQLEHLVTVETGLPSAARFEWVHRYLPGLITLNAYRRLTLIEQPSTVRFGWANKQIIKNLRRNEVLTMLEKSLKANRAVAPWTKEQWAERITQEYNDIAALPENARLKIKRPVKVQPIARVWYPRHQKQVQYACPSPLIVLCPDASRNSVPEIGELLNYDAENINHRHRPLAEPMTLMIPRLHLWLAP